MIALVTSSYLAAPICLGIDKARRVIFSPNFLLLIAVALFSYYQANIFPRKYKFIHGLACYIILIFPQPWYFDTCNCLLHPNPLLLNEV